jgi:hypothetical protein
MTRIINGEILQNHDPRVLAYDTAQRRSQFYAKYKYPVFIFILFSLIYYCSSSKDDALRNGQVPADERSWKEHWNYIREWDTFTRDMTSHESLWVRFKRGVLTVLNGPGEYTTLSDAAAERKSDGGGRGVPKPETSTLYAASYDQKSWAVTRCSSTRYAVTAYYCGLNIANNANGNAEFVDQVKHASSSHLGVQSLQKYLQKWYENTSSRKSKKDTSLRVLRLGLGQHERSTPPLEHVWSIICLPNGTFEWYQSYISFYSLHEWMDHVVEDQNQHQHQKQNAAYDMKRMNKKLSLLKDLTVVSTSSPLSSSSSSLPRWTNRMNVAYEQLFWVDVKKENKMKPVHWISENKLRLRWDVACPTTKERTFGGEGGEGREGREGSGVVPTPEEAEEANIQIRKIFMERNGRQPTSDEELEFFIQELMEDMLEKMKSFGDFGDSGGADHEEEEEDDTML